MTILAFIGICLAWSFSWFAMKLQIDSFVPIEISLLYRFVATLICMAILCLIARQRLKIKKQELPFLFIIGICNFSLNFLLGCYATMRMPSGMVAVIFSLSIITSEIMSSFADKRKIEKKVILSSLVGFAGLAFFVVPSIDFTGHTSSTKMLSGLGIIMMMVTVYSFGQVLVTKNRKLNNTPLYTTITYGCLFGAAFLLAVNFILGNKFTFDLSPSYTLSLAYLVLIASVIAFICIFYLINTIGSAKTNYSALIYPIIALITSSFLEGFKFSFINSIGVALVISALAIEFLIKKPVKKQIPNLSN